MKKIWIYYSAAAMLALSSCDLDINENPNFPANTDVTPDLIFPAVQNAIATASGDQMFTYAGFFAQYFEQRPEQNQYNNLAELDIDESTTIFNRCYSTLYSGALMDIKDIQEKTKNTADLYATVVLRAWAYQLLVDNLNSVPYSEALQGSVNPTPKWDEGKAVYEGVLKELDTAESAITGNSNITMKDPMFKGDLAKWKQFANALRLRMYLRLIDANIDAAGYTAKAKALVAGNNFFANDVKFDVYSDAEGQYNPWFGSIFKLKTNNYAACYPLVSYYVSTNDPRISYAILPNEADSKYVGQLPGAKTVYKSWGTDWKNKHVSFVNDAPAKAMPIYVFTQSELQFLKAEVELRFNNNVSAAKTAYEAGVAADFSSRGTSGVEKFLRGSKTDFDAQNTVADKLRLVYMQKWVALFYRDHMEAWSEIRRTDVPAMSAVSAKDVFKDPTKYTPGDMIAPAVNYKGNGGTAKRMPYPSSARQLNPKTPAVQSIADKVFWDVK